MDEEKTVDLEDLETQLQAVVEEQKAVDSRMREQLDTCELWYGSSLLSVPPPPPKGAAEKAKLSAGEKERDAELARRRVALKSLSDAKQFTAMAEEASVLAEQIEESRILSERVSRTVRQLDEAQMNVQQALALVEDVVNLKACANGAAAALREDDLVGATGYVRQFHDIHSVAAQASEDYERMVSSEKELQSKVRERFKAACAAELGSQEGGDLLSGEVAKYCALLGPLGLAQDGVEDYLAFARREIAQVTAVTHHVGGAQGKSHGGGGGGGQEGGAMDEEEALSRLFNGAWAFLQKHVSVAAAALSRANGGAALLRLVHADIEVEAVRLLQSYLRAKDVPNHVKEAVKFVGVGPPEGGGAFGNASSGPDGGALGKASLAVSELAMGVGGGASDGGAGPDGASSRFVAPAVVAGYEGGVEALVEALVDMALVMQHVESYDRVLRHTARQLEEDQKSSPPAEAPSSSDAVDWVRGLIGSSRFETKLNESVAELGGYYAVLEQAQLRASLMIALGSDDMPPYLRSMVLIDLAMGESLGAVAASAGSGGMGLDGDLRGARGEKSGGRVGTSAGAGFGGGDGGGGRGGGGDGERASLSSNSSTAVDHAFYVAREAAQRAVQAGHPQTCSAVINHVNAALSMELYDPLVSRAQKAAEALGRIAETSAGRSGAAGMAVMSAVADNATQYLNAAKGAAKGAARANKAGGVKASASALVSKAAKEQFGELLDGEKLETRKRHLLARGWQLIALNNLEASAECTTKLRDWLIGEARSAFEPGADLLRLEACVDELTTTASSFESARAAVVADLAGHLRPRLKSLVSEVLGEKSGFAGFQLSDEDYKEACDGTTSVRYDWVGRLLRNLEALLEPFLGRRYLSLDGVGGGLAAGDDTGVSDSVLSSSVSVISEGNAKLLVASVNEFLVKHVFDALRKQRFSALGAQKLDSDLRRLVKWFKRVGNRSKATKAFARLTYFVELLNLGSPKDALETWDSTTVRQLTADQVRKVLALREDFKRGEIDQLALK